VPGRPMPGLVAWADLAGARPAATAWNREARTFALTSAAYPTLNVSLAREQAVTVLVTAYFERYGPATVRDATWWSGLSATDITAALLACGRPVIAVATPWSDDPCLMFADQLAESTGNEAITTGVQFLAHEDTALKAYFQTRSRYLAGLPQQRAFNQIGEALPCVIVDGVASRVAAALSGSRRRRHRLRGVGRLPIPLRLPQQRHRHRQVHQRNHMGRSDPGTHRRHLQHRRPLHAGPRRGPLHLRH
jgi:hypothetical protein